MNNETRELLERSKLALNEALGVAMTRSELQLIKDIEAALAAPVQAPVAQLTDDQIETIFQSAADSDDGVHLRFARYIEAKIHEQIKNKTTKGGE